MSPRRPLATLRRTLFNLLAVTLPALLLLLLVLETGLRLAAPVSDVPDLEFAEPLGIRLAPGQEGTTVRGPTSEIRAEYRINSQGWNSPHDYDRPKAPDTTRIAVVGDSFVEAFQVDYDQSFPYLLERRLNAGGAGRHEVFSYGLSGANLAQYLAVVRQEVVPAAPDLVIVTIVHNDFQEALAGYSRIDNWSLARAPGGGWREVPPRPQPRLWLKRLLRHSALARYAIYNLSLHQRLFFLKALFQGQARRFEANIDVQLPVLAEPGLLAAMLDHLLAALAAEAARHDFELLLVMDAYRQPIYDGRDGSRSAPQRLSRALAAAAERQEVPLVDLTAAFEAAWRRDGRRFEWQVDHHWNGAGHEVVAAALAEWLLARRAGDAATRAAV